MAGRGRGERAAPANGVVDGVDFGHGLGVFPVGLDGGLGGQATGRPVQSGVAKNSVLRPLFMPKAVRGTGTPTPSASVEPCA